MKEKEECCPRHSPMTYSTLDFQFSSAHNHTNRYSHQTPTYLEFSIIFLYQFSINFHSNIPYFSDTGINTCSRHFVLDKIGDQEKVAMSEVMTSQIRSLYVTRSHMWLCLPFAIVRQYHHIHSVRQAKGQYLYHEPTRYG